MKYNWSIIGHEKQLETLEADIASGNLAHAYLLVGPDSIGKYTIAKKLAGILQCEKDFCHSCAACLQVEKGTHIDTVEFADDTHSIKIEDIRKLVERISMSKQAKYKVVLMQTIERMTPEAANSFLKTLEEPPADTIFILTSNNLRMLLQTIISRVRVVKFRSVSSSYLRSKLREIFSDCDEERAEQISRFSLGKTGKAIELAEQPEVLASHIKLYHDVQSFLNYRNVAERFIYIDGLIEEEYGVDRFLNMLTHVLRSKILEGGEETDRHIQTLLKIDEAGILLKKNINARLVLENLMLCL